MAFQLDTVNGYGTGALGSITNPTGQINSYANITAISGNTITIGTPSNGAYETFVVGKEILLHVSALTSGTDTTYLGNYLVATITAVNGSVLTLNKTATSLIDTAVLANHHVQAITIAQFDTLSLSATVAPLAYDVTNKYGGILAIKCKTQLSMSDVGKINLETKGIPIASVAYRPETSRETSCDESTTFGWENHIVSRKLYLNCPDGAVFLIAKATAIVGTNVRIGTSTVLTARYFFGCSQANGYKPEQARGGSTIMLVSETITGFTTAMINRKASVTTGGKGLGGCYIATNTPLNRDEQLYAADVISNPKRLSTIGIKDFGAGSLGDVVDPTGQINSYAKVTAISDKTITIGTTSLGIYEKFTVGVEVIVHISACKSTAVDALGKFYKTKIIGVSGTTITVADSPPFAVPIANYHVQLVTIPQFNKLTLTGTYDKTPACSSASSLYIGGICVMEAKDTLDISSAIIDVSTKGITFGSSGRLSIPTQCSGQQADYIPLGKNTGAVLLLAKNIVMNGNTRIGQNKTGAGYCGFCWTSGGAGYTGGGGAFNDYTRYGDILGNAGMPGLNASSVDTVAPGASLFIVADKITGFSVNAIGTAGNTPAAQNIYPGGAGTAFIYVNALINPDYTGVVV